jgi:hypothetical protein
MSKNYNDDKPYAGTLQQRVEEIMLTKIWIANKELEAIAQSTGTDSATAARRKLNKKYYIASRRNLKNPEMGKYQYRLFDDKFEWMDYQNEYQNKLREMFRLLEEGIKITHFDGIPIEKFLKGKKKK